MRGALGRTDLPGADAALLRQTVSRLVALLDDSDLILPGHGAAVRGSEARRWWDEVQAAATPAEL